MVAPLGLSQKVEKKLNEYCIKMLCAVLNKSWKQHSTKWQLYKHLPPFHKPFKLDQQGMLGTAGKVRTNILLWTPTHAHTSVGWPVKTYIHHSCVDTRCRLEDLPRVMANKECVPAACFDDITLNTYLGTCASI